MKLSGNVPNKIFVVHVSPVSLDCRQNIIVFSRTGNSAISTVTSRFGLSSLGSLAFLLPRAVKKNACVDPLLLPFVLFQMETIIMKALVIMLNALHF